MEIESNLQEELKRLEEKIKEAQETGGAQEIRDLLLEKAEVYNKHKMIDECLQNYELAYNKSVSISKKMDIIFSMMRIEILIKKNVEKTKEYIEKCQKLLLEGGDWERKNRLKVYQGLYCLQIRELKEGAELLLDCLCTFNTPELISYEDLVFLTVVTALITLDRGQIKTKIIDNPEIRTTFHSLPILYDYLNSYYHCNYQLFFKSFLHIIHSISNNFFLANHKNYYLRETRLTIYKQFLESYKTVTLLSMANSFGVSVQFIDNELSLLISQKKLSCKIDKVNGIIESERSKGRNGAFQQALKQGDLLINKIQKLSRQIDS